MNISAPSPTFDWSIIPGGSAPERGRRVLAGRYELGAALGSGGQGSVYRARDLLTGDELAVKMLPVLSTAARHRVNLEITALRWLRMPGVVQLRDDGVVDDMIFLVMDVVEGRPFPVGPLSWSELRPYALAILETLQAVHSAGVIHRDLKPSNILIDGHGRPVLIDFGLARGQAISRGPETRRSGTMQYSSPEQLGGDPCGPASDLYSLAVVLYEGLCGYLPHGHDWREIGQRRLSGELPPLPVGAPPGVAATLMALLALDPTERPQSAAEVIELLGGQSRDRRVERLCENLPEQTSVEQLKALFCGPDLFLHLREDAASILFERTDGWRDNVALELGRWLRQGLAVHKTGRLAVSRSALNRLGEVAPKLTLHASEALDELDASVDRLCELGQHARALGCLDRAVGLARRFNLRDRWGALLQRWARIAMRLQTDSVLNGTLAELGRAKAARLDVEPLERLVRGFWLARRGERDRAEHFLIDVQQDPELELLRVAARFMAGLPVLPAEISAYAGTAERRGHLESWLGLEAYRQGRYADALTHHRSALGLRRDPSGHLAVLNNAAAAALEAGALVDAAGFANEASLLAAELRAARDEALAVGTVRAAQYRQEAAMVCRPELVSAAEELGPWPTLKHAVTEAGVAFRSRDARGIELALRGAAAAKALDFGPAVELCQALALACGAEINAGDFPEARVPSLALQSMGLRALAGGVPRADLLQRAMLLRADPELAGHRGRLDVLSPDEVITACQYGRLQEN